jgi:hypothetical protein
MISNLMASALTFRRGTTEKLVFIGLNLLDLILTLFALSLGLNEMNPLVRSISGNLFQMYSVKLAIPLVIAWLLPGKLLIPSIVLLALVLGWDIKELAIFFFQG